MIILGAIYRSGRGIGVAIARAAANDAELVELMTKVLEEDGRFEVRIASNGFDAGMMVNEYRPDLIVLDVMLPDINGKEVCHRVRGDGTLEEVIHLGTPPQYTNLWWLQMLLACPRPITVAVHISVGDRRQEKARQRRRWKRHRSAVLYK